MDNQPTPSRSALRTKIRGRYLWGFSVYAFWPGGFSAFKRWIAMVFSVLIWFGKGRCFAYGRDRVALAEYLYHSRTGGRVSACM